MTPCVFCSIPERFHEQILMDSKYFYLLHDGYPIARPHLLLIPKIHVSCFGNLDRERLTIVDRFLSVLFDHWKSGVFFEHGGIGQTVFHAHLHLLQHDVDWSKLIERIPHSQVQKFMSMETISGQSEYLLMGKVGEVRVCKSGLPVEPAVLTNMLAELFHVPFPMEKRAKVTKDEISRVKNQLPKELCDAIA
ncbi:MAG: HIT domain-containing protein [Patescibacteria group bacterium]|nr:HIT domain-containing protein [Patescibacteria group bacterium]